MSQHDADIISPASSPLVRCGIGGYVPLYLRREKPPRLGTPRGDKGDGARCTQDQGTVWFLTDVNFDFGPSQPTDKVVNLHSCWSQPRVDADRPYPGA